MGDIHPLRSDKLHEPLRRDAERGIGRARGRYDDIEFFQGRVGEYPQSGERIRGRRNIQASRAAQPNQKRFTVRRILGGADLWVTEFVLTYNGRPSYTVSIMEFKDGKVARETQYFGDPFEPGPSRAQWVERMR